MSSHAASWSAAKTLSKPLFLASPCVRICMLGRRDNWSSRTSRDWLAPTGLASLTSLRLNLVKPSNGLSALTNLQVR